MPQEDLPHTTIVIHTIEDAERWYDETSLGEREEELKPVLTNTALEHWFSDLSVEDRQAAFAHLKGKTLKYIE